MTSVHLSIQPSLQVVAQFIYSSLDDDVVRVTEVVMTVELGVLSVWGNQEFCTLYEATAFRKNLLLEFARADYSFRDLVMECSRSLVIGSTPAGQGAVDKTGGAVWQGQGRLGCGGA